MPQDSSTAVLVQTDDVTGVLPATTTAFVAHVWPVVVVVPTDHSR